MQKTEPKKNWSITSNAFRRLLDWLDEGKNSDGHNYLEMRQRLVAYFDRKNCLTPEELADETLNRLARRIEEEGSIKSETPARYCYITARFVFMEYLRGTDKASVSLEDGLQNRLIATEFVEENEVKEKMLDCLEKCTGKLEPESRELIIGYYFGEERVKIENRRSMAQKFGISINALSIRACRIRNKLESCVGKCAAEN